MRDQYTVLEELCDRWENGMSTVEVDTAKEQCAAELREFIADARA